MIIKNMCLMVAWKIIKIKLIFTIRLSVVSRIWTPEWCETVSTSHENLKEQFVSLLILRWLNLKNVFSAAIESKMVKGKTVLGGVLWRCLDCSYSSQHKTTLARHIESNHVKGPGFNCEYCGKFCPTSNSLQVHISKNHRGQFSVVASKPLLW